jgi:hypothetical protein
MIKRRDNMDLLWELSRVSQIMAISGKGTSHEAFEDFNTAYKRRNELFRVLLDKLDSHDDNVAEMTTKAV